MILAELPLSCKAEKVVIGDQERKTSTTQDRNASQVYLGIKLIVWENTKTKPPYVLNKEEYL